LYPEIVVGGGAGGGEVTARVVAVVEVATTVEVDPLMAMLLKFWKVLSPVVGGLIANTIPC
jgi:hypothetical protein